MNVDSQSLLLVEKKNGVATLTMNMPKRLNGWTAEMLDALKEAMQNAADDDETKVVILTGADPYYCAGVNFKTLMKLRSPRGTHAMIVKNNQALFDSFIDFPKPILAAVNGPAIGASATSATLCDGIIASERATFSTPFAKLRVASEGCSSVLFPRIMGKENAARMLEKEGWVPTGTEAHEIGLAQWVVPHEDLLGEAQRIAEEWIAAGAVRCFRGSVALKELKATNAAESIRVADTILSGPFMEGQYRFFWSRKKRIPALLFFLLKHTRPVWARFL